MQRLLVTQPKAIFILLLIALAGVADAQNYRFSRKLGTDVTGMVVPKRPFEVSETLNKRVDWLAQAYPRELRAAKNDPTVDAVRVHHLSKFELKSELFKNVGLATLEVLDALTDKPFGNEAQIKATRFGMNTLFYMLKAISKEELTSAVALWPHSLQRLMRPHDVELELADGLDERGLSFMQFTNSPIANALSMIQSVFISQIEPHPAHMRNNMFIHRVAANVHNPDL